MEAHAVLTFAAIGGVAIFCQWLAWKVRLPAILFLLLAGILAGPVAGLLKPDELFGDLLFPLVSLSVAVILFEGSLTLRVREIHGVEHVIRNLVTVGTLVSWAAIAAATHWLVGFSWNMAILFGAIMTVTGPTVIVPMLRTVRPKQRVGDILRWEGILIDSIGAVLAVLVFEYLVNVGEGTALSETAVSLLQLVVVGSALGAAAGHALGLALRKEWLPEFLHNLATLSLVLLTFGVANAIQEEAGLVAVTVMGVWLANMRDVKVDEILTFKESLSILLISGLFVILAARVNFSAFVTLGWGALGLFLVMQFAARPLKVAVSSFGSTLSWRERAMVAWIGPRGIVAAAISAIFALKLEQMGHEQATLLVPLAFAVIIGTVVFQSATARWVARLLRVAEPEPNGVLIVGANVVAREVGKALTKAGFTVLLADGYWQNVRLARMDGLRTYYGSPVSEHADTHLDLVGLGRLLGLSPQPELNALASVHYKSDFGLNRVYALQTEREKDAPENLQVARPHAGYTLFSKDVTYTRLARMIAAGARVRTTKLSEKFTFEDLVSRGGEAVIPMFAISPKGELEILVEGGEFKPGPGWAVLSLAPADAPLPEAAPPAEERQDDAA